MSLVYSMRRTALLCAGVCVLVFTLTGCASRHAALQSWNDGATRQGIVDFVERVTDPTSPDFVEKSERIAVFDNDGTLWCEQPMYFQLLFAMDRVKQLGPQHPEWKNEQPFKAVLENDTKALVASGKEGLVKILMATHSGMTTDEFSSTVRQWLDTARHPKYGRKFTECVYQPMLELLEYLRDNGFKTFIVSGGGIEFMRVFTERVYGVPPEQVVGSVIKTKFEIRGGEPVLVRVDELSFVDDKEGKPVGIYEHIGRQPVFAAGNSDGDIQMLQYTDGRKGASFQMFVHHDDAVREFAYDRESHIGKLDQGLDEARRRGWMVVSMKEDWSVIFPPRAGK